MEKSEVKNERKTDHFGIRLVKGFVVGIAAMLPGVSGSVLAVSLGVYRAIIDALIDFFSGKHMKQNFLFLLPLVIGGVVGLLAVSRVLEWLLKNFPMPVMYAFLGMIGGGIPAFLKEARANTDGFKKKYIIAIVCGAAAVAGLMLLQRTLADGNPWPVNGWTLMLGGAILGFGLMVPGLSTSPLLINVGIYEPMLSVVNTFDIFMGICIAVGLAAMAAGMVILVKKTFERYPGYAYYSVLGFIIGTVIFIFPGAEWSLRQLLCVALMALGFLGTFVMCGGIRFGKRIQDSGSRIQ